jgi:hypothetical protein
VDFAAAVAAATLDFQGGVLAVLPALCFSPSRSAVRLRSTAAADARSGAVTGRR